MEKESYEKSVLEYEEVQTAIEYAKELAAKASYKAGVKKGKEEGRNEGMQEGIEKGREEGMQKGREEALIQTASNFLKLGISVADISKATGLSEEQIAALRP